MNRTKIEWTDYTWNPIKGICPVGCWYCYARRMYQRFKWDAKLTLETMVNPPHKKKGSKIFVCSTVELFHPQIKKTWRDYIFSVIKDLPDFTFQILTKFPQNIDRDMPDNVWLGITLTGKENFGGFNELKHFEYIVKAKMKFISHEPLLFEPMINIDFVDWIIVGRLTGYGRKNDPPKEWINSIVKSARRNSTSIFLKNNLKDIWGEPLIQEFPCVE